MFSAVSGSPNQW